MLVGDMVKLITPQQLVVGMFLHKLGGSWMDHPFWRKAFLLDKQADVDAIRSSGVTEVWIDTDRGLDVAPAAPAAAAQPPVAAPVAAAPAVPAAPAASAPRRAAFDEEVERARGICKAGTQAVAQMFREARMGRAISESDALPLVQEISASVLRNADAIISIARLKSADDYTYMHSVATCALMVALARQLGLDDATVRSAGVAGLMHDMGKAVMPAAVLNKPGKLTDAEFAVIRTHPREGWRLLNAAGGSSEATLDVVLHHHEKFDGSGYPDALAGDAISVLARMGAVCDVYDAVTSNRPYKAGWDPATSIRAMNGWAGHFDPTVMKAFIKSIGIYPTGSLVRLESGKLAVVVEQHAEQLLAPCVKVFYSTKSKEPIPRVVVNLAAAGCTERIAGVEDPAKWGFKNLDALWAA